MFDCNLVDYGHNDSWGIAYEDFNFTSVSRKNFRVMSLAELREVAEEGLGLFGHFLSGNSSSAFIIPTARACA